MDITSNSSWQQQHVVWLLHTCAHLPHMHLVLQALPAAAQAGGNQQAGGLGLSLARGWGPGEEGQQGAAGGGGEGGEEHTRVSWLCHHAPPPPGWSP